MPCRGLFTSLGLGLGLGLGGQGLGLGLDNKKICFQRTPTTPPLFIFVVNFFWRHPSSRSKYQLLGFTLLNANPLLLFNLDQTRSKGSVNLPQGFVGLTLIGQNFKDFQGMKEIIHFCQKISSQNWQKISLQSLKKNLPDLLKKIFLKNIKKYYYYYWRFYLHSDRNYINSQFTGTVLLIFLNISSFSLSESKYQIKIGKK